MGLRAHFFVHYVALALIAPIGHHPLPFTATFCTFNVLTVVLHIICNKRTIDESYGAARRDMLILRARPTLLVLSEMVTSPLQELSEGYSQIYSAPRPLLCDQSDR